MKYLVVSKKSTTFALENRKSLNRKSLNRKYNNYGLQNFQ